jgi:hypothetical protein
MAAAYYLRSACCKYINESVGAIKGVEFLWPKWLNMTEYYGQIYSNPAWYLVDLAGINLGPKTSYIKISQLCNGTTLLVRCDVFVVSRWCDAALLCEWFFEVLKDEGTKILQVSMNHLPIITVSRPKRQEFTTCNFCAKYWNWRNSTESNISQTKDNVQYICVVIFVISVTNCQENV